VVPDKGPGLDLRGVRQPDGHHAAWPSALTRLTRIGT
jgi:hypothetical protein